MTETYFIGRGSEEGAERKQFRELSRVIVDADVVTLEGDRVAAGSCGTIVAVWREGDFYDVEFGEAAGPATIEASLLRPL